MSSFLKGPLSLITHCGGVSERKTPHRVASPQGSTRNLRQQEPKEEAEAVLGPGVQVPGPK